MVRSIEALTAAESSGLPVWKVTPERRVNVQVLPSELARHEVARRGPAFLVTGL
ncbi:hypothetical protein [Nonomuraea dietziae]|uniref:hypothetical protein n=1 Tax=Nonomuraea dietziae TaxID=65515 RepID=UPI0031D189C8